jgi:molybdopterin biosynthesis enzyme
MGALISSGIFTVRVWKRPVVAIIPTGTELVHYRRMKDFSQLKKNAVNDLLKKYKKIR